MPNGIRLGVAADTREFETGVKKGIIDPLDDASDALRDLAKDGDRAGSELEGSFRGQQEVTKKLDREYRDLGDTIRQTSRKAGRDIDSGIGDGLDKASDGMGDFKDEAKSTAREGAASFSGEFSDVGDVIQETLANALGGFGPIGAAAGIAAAVGFGAISAAVEAEAEASEERVNAMYEKMLESKGVYLTESAILDSVSELVKDQGKLAEANDIAAKSGQEVGVVLRALAGDTEALAEVNGALTDKQDELHKAMDDGTERTAAQTEAMTNLDKELQAAKNSLSTNADEVQKSSEMYEAYASAVRFANNQMQDAAQEAAGLTKQIRQLPNGKTITITTNVDSSSISWKVRNALAEAQRLANAGIDIPYQITKNGTKVY